jgi:hypothetical protein
MRMRFQRGLPKIVGGYTTRIQLSLEGCLEATATIWRRSGVLIWDVMLHARRSLNIPPLRCFAPTSYCIHVEQKPSLFSHSENNPATKECHKRGWLRSASLKAKFDAGRRHKNDLTFSKIRRLSDTLKTCQMSSMPDMLRLLKK